jgi:hypothetical protein
VLVVFVTVDGEVVARKVWKRAQNGGRKRKIREVIENSDDNNKRK